MHKQTLTKHIIPKSRTNYLIIEKKHAPSSRLLWQRRNARKKSIFYTKIEDRKKTKKRRWSEKNEMIMRSMNVCEERHGGFFLFFFSLHLLLLDRGRTAVEEWWKSHSFRFISPTGFLDACLSRFLAKALRPVCVWLSDFRYLLIRLR